MTKIFELVNKVGGVSYSPKVIWTQLFLLHKNIQFTPIPLTFTNIGPTIREVTGGKWSKVPTVIFPNGIIKYDSIPICNYLDIQYPQNPIKSPKSKAEPIIYKFRESIGESHHKLVVLDIDRNLDEASRVYVRNFKEKAFGMTLENFSGNESQNYDKFYNSIEILKPILEGSPYFEGDKSGFSDYLLSGLFQFIRTINPQVYRNLIHDSPSIKLSEWANRMDNLFDGYLKNRKTL